MSKQKVAIITGAAGQLGRAVSARFLSSGYKVIATVQPGQRPLRVEGVSHQPAWSPINLANERDAQTLINTLVAKYKHIDAALMIAGGFAMGNIFNTGSQELAHMFRVNFETAYFTARPLFQQMCKQSTGGRMVFVGARPAFDPQAGKDKLAYSLSKSLVINLAKLLNAEGKDKGVTASVFIPSIIDTPGNRAAMPNADFNKWVKPEKIAALMEMVCSDTGSPLRETVMKVYGDS